MREALLRAERDWQQRALDAQVGGEQVESRRHLHPLRQRIDLERASAFAAGEKHTLSLLAAAAAALAAAARTPADRAALAHAAAALAAARALAALSCGQPKRDGELLRCALDQPYGGRAKVGLTRPSHEGLGADGAYC